MRLGLARDLVALADLLDRRREAIGLFEPGAVKRLAEQPEVGGLLAELAAVTWTPQRVLRLVLQALQVQADEVAPRLIETELVATLSKGIPGTARPTAQVLKDMLKPAPRDIVIVGYEVTDKDVVGLLTSAARAGGRITVICDRGKASGGSLLANWPADIVRPIVYQDRASRTSAKYAKMHGKAVLVGDDDLFITSANLTFHGLRGNIELGVRLRGGPALEAAKVFRHLIDAGLVERVPDGCL